MTVCPKISPEEITLLLSNLRLLYDLVRIVDPATTQVQVLDNGQLTPQDKDACFSVWEKDGRCANCISLNACTTGRKMTKFEYCDSHAYCVLSVPFTLCDASGEHTVALELVNRVENNIFVEGTGSNADAIAHINHLLYEDSLTGTFNRRYFDESLYISDKLKVLPNRVGFLLIDVHRFKLFNDTYGHATGDEVLKKVAKALEANTRSADIVMRVGGDEFLVALRDCDESYVAKKAAQLKRTVAGLRIEGAAQESVQIDIGEAYTGTFDGSPSQIADLFERADQSMYLQKNGK